MYGIGIAWKLGMQTVQAIASLLLKEVPPDSKARFLLTKRSTQGGHRFRGTFPEQLFTQIKDKSSVKEKEWTKIMHEL